MTTTLALSAPSRSLVPATAFAPGGTRRTDDPRREMLAGAALAALLVIGFGGWALTTRLDAAVISPGTVRVSDARQVIQTPNGGVVAVVRVANGAQVAAGQVLVEFATAEALAQERALAARVFALQAEIARIGAELQGVAPPAAFAGLAADDREQAAQALAMEQAQLDAQRSLEASQLAVLRDRGAQVDHQIEGTRERLVSTNRQRSLNQQELEAYRGLYAKGLATKPRLLALERSGAAIDGDAGATQAEIARLKSQAGEARVQYLEVKTTRATQNAARLREAQTELATVLPQWQAAAEQLRRTVLRAPFAGTVTGLKFSSAGTVLGAGAPVLELVPERGALTVEAQVAVTDAADLTPGQHAEVRLSAFHGRLLPPIDGTVTRVSADSTEEERSGRSYYTATVRIAPAALRAATGRGEFAGIIRPGTPVEVIVVTKPRSAFDYLIGPLTQRLHGAFAAR